MQINLIVCFCVCGFLSRFCFFLLSCLAFLFVFASAVAAVAVVVVAVVVDVVDVIVVADVVIT